MSSKFFVKKNVIIKRYWNESLWNFCYIWNFWNCGFCYHSYRRLDLLLLFINFCYLYLLLLYLFPIRKTLLLNAIEIMIWNFCYKFEIFEIEVLLLFIRRLDLFFYLFLLFIFANQYIVLLFALKIFAIYIKLYY